LIGAFKKTVSNLPQHHLMISGLGAAAFGKAVSGKQQESPIKEAYILSAPK